MLATPVSGSSPLTRGKRSDPRVARVRRGLIPAHAGKTASSPTRTQAIRAHPRSRGENGIGIGLVILRLGSSPLTRGKQGTQAVEAELRGLIPAHAGKTADDGLS